MGCSRLKKKEPTAEISRRFRISDRMPAFERTIRRLGLIGFYPSKLKTL